MADINNNNNDIITPSADQPAPPPSALAAKLKAPPASFVSAPDYSGILKTLQEKSEKGRPASAQETLQNFQALSDQAIKEADQKADIDPEYRRQADILRGVNDQIQNTKDLMTDKQVTGDWLRTMESIGQSLVQLAAAKYGQQKGINLSGLKMQPTDWDSVVKNSLDRMQNDLTSLRGDKRAAESLQNEARQRYQQAGARGVAEAQNASEKGKAFDLEQANKEANIGMKQLDVIFDASKFNVSEARRELGRAGAVSPEDKQAQVMFRDIKNKQLGDLKSDLSGLNRQATAIAKAQGEFEKLQESQASGDLTDKDITKLSATVTAKLQAAGINRKEALETTQHLFGLWKSEDENPAKLSQMISDKLKDVHKTIDQKEALQQSIINTESPLELKSVLDRSGLGKKPEDMIAPTTAQPGAVPGTPPPPRALSSMDQQALEWAKNNATDPRAVEIRKRLGQ